MVKVKSFNNILDEICFFLDTYRGRDKVLRTLCYSTKLIGAIHGNEVLADKFTYFSKHMSGTRATLRLLDDLPMLKYSIEYGLGRYEPDKFMSWTGVTTNIVDQIYYPIEKMSWLAEHKLITGVDNNKWDTASSICWVASIFLTMIRAIKSVSILEKQMKSVDIKNSESASVQKLTAKQKYELFTCIRLSLDLVHAVNTLPPGFLWSSKLNTWHVGLLGTISSILGLYQCFAKP